ncbi:MAG: polymer-forming cytoskeletal protein [Gemmatimonadota bacterium]|nr:MAG: polymer-forming cytoskeletal protein [Gemmatimonadota bacterium]
MAMFSSTGRETGAKPSPRSNGTDDLSILGPGARVKGELEVDGVIKIEGAVDGTVRARGQVLVVKGGKVQGDIYGREVVVGGEVRGGVFADERAEIQATSVINGDITTPQITVLEGGTINGKINMAKPKAADHKPAPIREMPQDEQKEPTQLGELRRTG